MPLDKIDLRAYRIALQKAETFSRMAGYRVNPEPLIADAQEWWAGLSPEQQEREWQLSQSITRRQSSASSRPAGR